MQTPLPYRKSDLPEARSGEWVIERFEVPQPAFTDPGWDTRPDWIKSPPGTYTRLRRDNEVFMTDLRDEWWTQLEFIEEACRRGGNLLITGLGLGLVVEEIMGKAGSERLARGEIITVLELSEDVIRLVARISWPPPARPAGCPGRRLYLGAPGRRALQHDLARHLAQSARSQVRRRDRTVAGALYAFLRLARVVDRAAGGLKAAATRLLLT